MFFFLVEEQSDGASKAGVPSSASLRAGAGGPVQTDRTSIFFGVKLMLFGAMNFGQIKKKGLSL